MLRTRGHQRRRHQHRCRPRPGGPLPGGPGCSWLMAMRDLLAWSTDVQCRTYRRCAHGAAICAFMHGFYPLRGKHYHEMINPFRVLTDVSYIHVFQVKKLIKEKKNDAGISEYIDINKELQEVYGTMIHLRVSDSYVLSQGQDDKSFCC
ncbi:uncharacterized protein [Zea mays]|uniref:uncharacterized protein isoform X2 n=1 Tax=Zea mays TaxID=4577 RepID=UPI0009AAD992|nr:uncharacterized protein LOC103630394 isoform X2 [Zea mays]|eukprot:XP_020395159.1 uncharacterized protein LOC103630394 isoform X2 [Zea mays]